MSSVYLMMSDDTKALEAAKEAVALEPDFPVAQNNLAVALPKPMQIKQRNSVMQLTSDLLRC